MKIDSNEPTSMDSREATDHVKDLDVQAERLGGSPRKLRREKTHSVRGFGVGGGWFVGRWMSCN